MEYVISPPRKVASIGWRELWRFRDLFLTLAQRDLSVRYRQAALGAGWAILQPVLTMLIFTFIFNRMANIQSGDATPYPVFLYVGLLVWQLFSGTLSGAANSMVSNASLIQKVYFPRLIIPATAATTGLADFAIASVILVGLMFWYGCVPRLAGLLILPLLVGITTLTAMGAGLFLAAVNIKYRDVRYVVPFLIQVLMYVTPVIYPIQMLDRHPVAKVFLYWLNPVAVVITNARSGLLAQAPVDWASLGVGLLVSALMFIIGLYHFRNAERYFADIA